MPKSRKLRPSSTPGKSKNSNCQKSVAKNYVVLDTKGYRKDIALWIQGCKEISAMKGNLPTQEILELRRMGVNI
jgi:hypothetical protein